MAEPSGIYTKDMLEELDAKLNYMVYGQGFVLCIVDPKPTRRRTLVNMMKKAGIESIDVADGYEQTEKVLKKYPDDKVVLITDLDLGKINGLRLVTGLMLQHKGLCGIILTDDHNQKLEHVAAVTKAVAVRVRPFECDDILEIIQSFGFKLTI